MSWGPRQEKNQKKKLLLANVSLLMQVSSTDSAKGWELILKGGDVKTGSNLKVNFNKCKYF